MILLFTVISFLWHLFARARVCRVCSGYKNPTIFYYLMFSTANAFSSSFYSSPFTLSISFSFYFSLSHRAPFNSFECVVLFEKYFRAFYVCLVRRMHEKNVCKWKCRLCCCFFSIFSFSLTAFSLPLRFAFALFSLSSFSLFLCFVLFRVFACWILL